MKRVVTVFPRQTYTSSTAGAMQLFVHDEKLCSLLGQADTIRVQFIGHRQSASTARAKVTVWESSWPAVRPNEAQQEVGSGFTFTDLRPALQTVSGPFSGLLEFQLEIDDSAATDVVQFELEIHVTLIMD